MKTRAVSVICAALVVASFGGHRALGQGVDQDRLNRAKSAWEEGKDHFTAGAFLAAADKFLEAYEAKPVPAFLYNAAVAYQKSKCYVKAIENYEKYLTEDPEAQDAADVKNKVQVLKEAATNIPLAKQGCTAETVDQAQSTAEVNAINQKESKVRGLVIIETEPNNAVVYIGSKNNPPVRSPWNGQLEGTVTIFIEKPGYKPHEKSYSASPDKLLLIFVALSQQDYLGFVEVTSNVPGSDVFIDDKSVGVRGRTPYSSNLEPGKHKVWVTKAGYDEYFTEVEVVAGEVHKVNATLEGKPVGWIDLRGPEVEFMSMSIDGQMVCERGPCNEPVQEGTHTILIKRKGYKPYKREITLQQGTKLTIRPKLVKQPGRGDAIAAYIFSGVFLGGGIYLGLQANSIHDEIEKDIAAGMPPVDPGDSRFTRGKIFAIAANATFALAGLSALTGVYYTFRDKGGTSTAVTDVRAVSFEPHIGPGYAGMGMEVRW